MKSFQYFLLVVFIRLTDLFVLLDSPPLKTEDLVKYNGDRSSTSSRSSNSYYSLPKKSSSSSSLIDFMKTLYEQEKVLEEFSTDYNLIRGLAPRIVEIDNVTMFVFDLNVIRRTENLHSVSLHFYKRRTRWPISYALNEIYSSHRLSSLSAQIQLESDAFGWQSFPIGDVIQRQLNYLSSAQKSEYFGLTFKPTVTTNSQRRNIIELEKFSVHMPFMIFYSNDSKQTNVFDEFIPKNFEQESKSYEQFENDVNRINRSRRSVDELLFPIWNNSLSIVESETCSLKPLVIDFSDLGFSSWLLEPKSYMANLCSGSCQPKLMTNHGLVQYFLQRLGVRNDIELPDSSCVPERYSSLTIFYRSSDYNYLIRRVPNMIVDECHCR